MHIFIRFEVVIVVGMMFQTTDMIVRMNFGKFVIQVSRSVSRLEYFEVKLVRAVFATSLFFSSVNSPAIRIVCYLQSGKDANMCPPPSMSVKWICVNTTVYMYLPSNIT